MVNEKGQFTKGEHASPETEFKKGQHWRSKKPYWDKDWLYREYVTNQRSAADIANEQGCKTNNVLYFIHKHGIPTRTTEETRKIKHWGLFGKDNPMYGRAGSSNHNWRGGCTPDRQSLYCSSEWGEVVKSVWLRDEATCKKCGIKKSDGASLHIHHIVSFSVEKLRTELSNLILLCEDCHHWVHSKKNVDKKYIKEV